MNKIAIIFTFFFIFSGCESIDDIHSKGLKLESPSKKFVAYYYSLSDGGGVGSSKDMISIMKYEEQFSSSDTRSFFESTMIEKICLNWVGDHILEVYLPDIIRMGGLSKEDINPKIDNHIYKQNKVDLTDNKIKIVYHIIPNSNFKSLCPGLWGSVGGFDSDWNDYIEKSRR